VKQLAALKAKLDQLRERYAVVELVEQGLARTDAQELQAAEGREVYAQFVAEGGYYGTHRLAQEAAAKATRPIDDDQEGRAAMHIPDLLWERDEQDQRTKYFGYHSTRWSIKRQDIPYVDSVTGAIKQAYLQRERVSSAIARRPKYRWFLFLVVDEDPAPHQIAEHRTAAGLDLCWRGDEGDHDLPTLRVAYVANETSHHEAITMPARAYAQLQHSESIQSLADKDANVLRAELGLPAQTSHRTLLERCSPDHKVGRHLLHLAEWAHHERRHALDARDEHYLLQAHRLLAQHHTIYVERMKGNDRHLVQTPSKLRQAGVSEPDSHAKAGKARDQRQACAPFTFLRLLQREAVKFGSAVVELDPAYTSRICTCGHDMGPGSQAWRRCRECGERWDVDRLAAINLLARGLDGDRGDASAAVPRKTPEALDSAGIRRLASSPQVADGL
jgi:hypothetical protein